jgi:hypothetical protein
MMKLCFSLITVLTLVNIATISLDSRAQAPQKINFQAVIRNSSNTLVVSTAIGMRISILQGSTTGLEVYKEIYNPNPQTNENGLVTLQIGGGIPLSGIFESIKWGNDQYFIKVEIDPTGGTNYVLAGISQLLSVPYALFAKTAENGFSGNYNDLTNKPITDGSETKLAVGANINIIGSGTTASPYVISATSVGGNFTHYIGELFGGGIVVAVWKKDGIEKGLIASLTDISSGISWSNITTLIGTIAQSPIDGLANTAAIISQIGHISSAAKLCDDFTSGGFSDWYLPSIWELNQCYNSAFIINSVLGKTNGFQFDYYWSSTETYDNFAGFQYFDYGSSYFDYKTSAYRVRAVRKF